MTLIYMFYPSGEVVEKCQKVPKTVCVPSQRNVCENIPRETCNQVPRTNCLQVPKEICADNPITNCNQIPQQKCYDTTEEVCSDLVTNQCEQVQVSCDYVKRWVAGMFFGRTFLFYFGCEQCIDLCLLKLPVRGCVAKCPSKLRRVCHMPFAW